MAQVLLEVAFPDGWSTVGVILADQVKSLDWRARQAKLFERAPIDIVAETLGKIQVLLEA